MEFQNWQEQYLKRLVAENFSIFMKDFKSRSSISPSRRNSKKNIHHEKLPKTEDRLKAAMRVLSLKNSKMETNFSKSSGIQKAMESYLYSVEGK